LEKYKLELQLEQVFKAANITQESPEKPLPAYRKLERATYASEVQVPILDVTMTTGAALWTLTALLLLVCILLLDASIKIQSESLQQREENWLILDSVHGPLSSVLAGIWVVLLLVAPILIVLGHLVYLWLRFASGEGSGWMFSGVVIALLGVAAVGARLSWQAVQALRTVQSADRSNVEARRLTQASTGQ
jgi:hypothetical protein